jgi:hypothetical protein
MLDVLATVVVLALCIWWMHIDDKRMEDTERGLRQRERDYLSRMYLAKRNMSMRQRAASRRNPKAQNRTA